MLRWGLDSISKQTIKSNYDILLLDEYFEEDNDTKKVFEKYFLTPHNLNFAELTKGFGVKHTLIKNWNHFRNSFITAINNKNIQVLELNTDSIQSLKIREHYWNKVRQTL